MKIVNRIIIIVTLLILVTDVMAQTRQRLSNDIGMEMMGVSLLYSLSCQRMLSSQIGLQSGTTLLGMGLNGNNGVAISISVGLRYYFIMKNYSPFVTSGIVMLNESVPEMLLSMSFEKVNYIGVGFEHRFENGLLFRWTVYNLYGKGCFLIWPGVFVGYAFD